MIVGRARRCWLRCHLNDGESVFGSEKFIRRSGFGWKEESALLRPKDTRTSSWTRDASRDAWSYHGLDLEERGAMEKG